MPKFCRCRFGPLDGRRYTYLTDGHDVAVGDFVQVPDSRSGIGARKRVEVMELTDDEPDFECKAILGKVTGEDTDARLLGRAGAEAAPLVITDDDPLGLNLPF